MKDKHRKEQTEKITIKLLKFIALLLFVLVSLIFITSCEDNIIDELPDNYTMELDGRLDTTDDGLV